MDTPWEQLLQRVQVLERELALSKVALLGTQRNLQIVTDMLTEIQDALLDDGDSETQKLQ